MTVFKQEADIGHMTAVGTVLMARSLQTHTHTHQGYTLELTASNSANLYFCSLEGSDFLFLFFHGLNAKA